MVVSQIGGAVSQCSQVLGMCVCVCVHVCVCVCMRVCVCVCVCVCVLRRRATSQIVSPQDWSYFGRHKIPKVLWASARRANAHMRVATI